MILGGAVVGPAPTSESVPEATLRLGAPTAKVPERGDSVLILRNGVVIEVRPILEVSR